MERGLKMDKLKFSVIGAGKGGCTTAGHVAYMGHDVTLWNRPGDKIEILKAHPIITLEGKINGEGRLACATDDLGEAVDGADIVSIMTTCDAYEDLVPNLAPYLQDGQLVILNNGGIGGSLLFDQLLRQTRTPHDVRIAEIDVCVYGCKTPEIGKALMKSIKDRVYFGTLNSHHTKEALARARIVYPQFTECELLEVGFRNITVLHSPVVVLNEGRIRRKEDFNFFTEGITPEIGPHLEKIDRERMAVAYALGLGAETVNEWLNTAYGVEPGPLHEMVRRNEPYTHHAPAPKDFRTRILTEDVPGFLVPQLEIAAVLGIEQPLTKKIAEAACRLTGENYLTTGRTLDKLGLTQEDIRNYSRYGLQPYLERNGILRRDAA
jgi:opine dehydrogenase